MVLVSHEPFLQSKAQMLIMPVSTDGNISHPVIARCKRLFADNYDQYQKKAMGGELVLGEAWICRLARQTTGLDIQTGGAEYIANLITQKFPEQPISVRLFRRCLVSLKPQIYELMRYKGVRRVAILGSALVVKDMPNQESGVIEWLTAEKVVKICQEVLGDVPKLTIEVYFGKNIQLTS